MKKKREQVMNTKGKNAIRLIFVLSVTAATITTPVLSIQFASREDAARFFAIEQQRWQERNERIKSAFSNDDDVALKKEIVDLCNRIALRGTQSGVLQDIMCDYEVPPKKTLQVLREMIRDGLSTLEEVSDIRHEHALNELFVVTELLYVLPESEETLALIQECLQSKNQYVRARVENIVERQTYKHMADLNYTNVAQIKTTEQPQPSATTKTPAVVRQETNVIQEPVQSPVVVEKTQTNRVPVTDTQLPPDPDKASSPKTTPSKLPLLIGIIATAGAIMAWCCFRKRKRI